MSPRTDERGFTLIELMMATFIIVVGVLGLASTMANVSMYQARGASRMEMVAVGESKLEELRAYAMIMSADTAQLTVGGSITSSVANHSDTITGPSGRVYIRRWRMDPGPAGTRQATLRVIPEVDNVHTVSRVKFTTLLMVVR